jgi:predicted HicB family RNase H-like nuclease
MIEYKGYVGRVEFDDEAGIFHGEVVNTRDVITFQGATVDELRNAFQESVDDYLAYCRERGEQPEKPYSGQFVTRVSPDLHRKISTAASFSGKSLNAWVAEQLEKGVQNLNREKKPSKGGARARSKTSKSRETRPTRLRARRDP